MAETLFDCLCKLADATVPTAAEARDALKRINELEATKPTIDQMKRYGTLAGVSGLGIGVVTDLMRGKIPYKPTDAAGNLLKGRAAVMNVGRNVAAGFAKGALGGGAVPLLRHHVDRDVEMQRLRAYVESRPKKAVVAPPPEAPPPPIPQMQPNLMGGLSTGAEASPSLGGMKVANAPGPMDDILKEFQNADGVIDFDQGLRGMSPEVQAEVQAHIDRARREVEAHQAAANKAHQARQAAYAVEDAAANAKPPPLPSPGTKRVGKYMLGGAAVLGGLAIGKHLYDAHNENKEAGVPLTPAGRLAHSSRMGKTPGSTNTGPSIADQVKPIGPTASGRNKRYLK